MREIHVQKTVQNAANLCAENSAKCVKLIYAKNSAKCVQLICKKQCEMRSEFRGVFCIENWRIFSVFLGKFAKNCMVIFYIFQVFS